MVYFNPLVLMIYRSLVYEYTRIIPYSLILGHEMCLLSDVMYTFLVYNVQTSSNKYVLNPEEAFRKTLKLMRRNTTAQQTRCNFFLQ